MLPIPQSKDLMVKQLYPPTTALEKLCSLIYNQEASSSLPENRERGSRHPSKLI